jgi:tetratricopeptide (TPR) repeat protein
VLFTILGSAGVGKSRLAAEFLDELDAVVVRGRCLSYGEGITYWPVAEVARQLLQGRPPPSPALAALLGEGDAPADEIAFAVRRLLEAEASARPLVVVFDDLQWGEPTFLDLVEHVADWSRDAPILLLCLARPDLLERRPGWGGGKLNATTVLLEPLTGAETDRLIDELLGGAALDEAVRGRIHAAAEGNPLFVEQMLAMLQESPGEVAVPATIQALLAARLDQLPARERAALERGAVEGQVFHRGAVVALDGDAESLPPLVRKELVRPSAATLPDDDAFRFRHLLIRDAAYDSLPKAVRAELHERFADWLAEHAPGLVELDEIAGYHLEQAARYRSELGDARPALERRASERLAAAGRRAEAREDQPAAEALLRRALRLLPAGSAERLRLLPSYGWAVYQLGRLDEAYGLFDEAVAHGDADTAAQAFFMVLGARGHGESLSAQELERAAREKLDSVEETVGPRALAAGYDTLAWALYWQGRNREAIEAGERALELALEAGARVTAVDAARLVAGAMMQGATPWSEVARQAERMAELGIFSDHVLSWGLTMQGRVEEARALRDEQTQRLRERGQLVWAYGLGMGAGYLELISGNAGAAERILREAWNGLGGLGERGFRSTIGGFLGRTLGYLGRFDEATAILDEAVAISTPDDWLTASEVAAGRAVVASRQGDHAAASAYARRAVELVDQTEYLTSQQDLRLLEGEVLLAAGRLDDARRACEGARAAAERKGSTILLERIDALLAAMRSAAPPA